MGAWIETVVARDACPIKMSHPTWVRGLKLQVLNLFFGEKEVAPYVGAWIETLYGEENEIETCVAPYVGAWIETSVIAEICS